MIGRQVESGQLRSNVISLFLQPVQFKNTIKINPNAFYRGVNIRSYRAKKHPCQWVWDVQILGLIFVQVEEVDPL